MEQLTKDIIGALRRNGRASFTKIARELDMLRDGVAHRINPLLQSGKLRIIADPHPHVLGLTVSAHLSIKASGNPRRTVDALSRLESPLNSISVVAGAYHIIVEASLAGMTELARLISVIRALDGVTEVQTLIYEQVLSSFCLSAQPRSIDFNLEEIDIRLIKLLQQDGRTGYALLAEKTGISLSGCRSRVQRMLAAGIVQIGVVMCRSDLDADLLFGIGVNADADCRDVMKYLSGEPGLEFMARTIGRYDLIGMIRCASILEFNQTMSRLLSLSSVKGCEQWQHLQTVRGRYDHIICGDLLSKATSC